VARGQVELAALAPDVILAMGASNIADTTPTG
jgi:hypothetical protein